MPNLNALVTAIQTLLTGLGLWDAKKKMEGFGMPGWAILLVVIAGLWAVFRFLR
jgi:hypothetical protein